MKITVMILFVLMTCRHFSIFSEIEIKKFWTKICSKKFFRGVKKYLKEQWNIYFRNILCLTRIHSRGLWIQMIRRRFRKGLFRQFDWWDLGRWGIWCQHGPIEELWTIFSLTSDFVTTIFGKPNIQNVNYVMNYLERIVKYFVFTRKNFFGHVFVQNFLVSTSEEIEKWWHVIKTKNIMTVIFISTPGDIVNS